MPTEQIPTPRPKRTTTKTTSKTTAAATAAPAATTAASTKPVGAKAAAGAKAPASKQAATARTAKGARPRPSDVAAPMIDPEYRRALIAEAAYLRAERRNFAPGYEVEDWLNAESEIDTRLTLGVVSPTK